MAKEKCGLKGCEKPLGPGAAAVGYENEGRVSEVRVCSEHAWTIMMAPRGSYRITEDRELKAIPAKRIFI